MGLQHKNKPRLRASRVFDLSHRANDVKEPATSFIEAGPFVHSWVAVISAFFMSHSDPSDDFARVEHIVPMQARYIFFEK